MRNKSIALLLVAIVVSSAAVAVVVLHSTNDEGDSPRVAFVVSTFSNTAYSSAFYSFYSAHLNDNLTYITTDLELLNVTIKPGWSWSRGLYWFLNRTDDILPQLFGGARWTTIDERDVA